MQDGIDKGHETGFEVNSVEQGLLSFTCPHIPIWLPSRIPQALA